LRSQAFDMGKINLHNLKGESDEKKSILSLILAFVVTNIATADPNLVGWWKFDEGSGMDANDSAGNNHGTLVNGPIWTTGRTGGALQFDGVDDYVEVPNSNSLQLTNAITVAAWAKVDSFDVWRTIVSKGQSGIHEFWFGYRPTNRLDFKFNGLDGRNNPSNTVITDSDWHHLAGVYDGNDIYVFIDGLLDNMPMSYVDINYNTGTLNIAHTKYWNCCNPDGSDCCRFTGLIDEVSIYNRSLTEDEIYDLYIDLNGDGFIGWGDLGIICDYWLDKPSEDPNVKGDLNNDDIMNFLDFAKYNFTL